MTAYNKLDVERISRLLFPAIGSFAHVSDSCQELQFEIDDNISLSGRFYEAAQDCPSVIFLPSPSQPLTNFSETARFYTENGINILAVNYRNFEESESLYEFSTFIEDCDKLFDLAKTWLKDKGYDQPIFLMGQSVSAVAAMHKLSLDQEVCKGLLIESCIYETTPFLQALDSELGTVDLEEEEGFDLIAKIETLKLPTLMFHGAKDNVVSVSQAEKLQSHSGAKTKRFFVIPGADHNSVSQVAGLAYGKEIKKFMDTVCGVNVWRSQRSKLKRSRYKSQ